jgi:hypothetical protein
LVSGTGVGIAACAKSFALVTSIFDLSIAACADIAALSIKFCRVVKYGSISQSIVDSNPV